MRKKALSSLKIAVLVCTLTVLGLGAVATPAHALNVDIYCAGSGLCATVETPDVIIDFYLGEPFLIVIY